MFSAVQRKVLTPSEFPDVQTVEKRLLDFQAYYETIARPWRGSSLGRSWTNSWSNSPDTSSTSKGPLPEGRHEYLTELTSQST
jgi:hypothetical protein